MTFVSLNLMIWLLGCLAMLPSFGLCQPDCAQLGFGPGTRPTSGADLEVCSINQQQCCSDDYIASVKAIAENTLKEGLTLELNETSYMFSRTVELIINNYFNTTFREGWILFFPNPGGLLNLTSLLPEIYHRLVMDFLNNRIISDTTRNFNASRFIQNIVEAITTSVGNVVSRGVNVTLKTCTEQHLNNSVNNMAYYNMVSQIETLRRGVTSFRNFEEFFGNFTQNTNDYFKFPSNCVDRFVSISFCGRCKEKIPPLCSNTCGALIRGCYSPYYGALPDQFDTLWNVSCQVLEVVNSTTHGLFAEGQRLFDETMVEKLPSVCDTTVEFQSMANNFAEYLIPNERMQELRDMRGRGLSYGDSGPMICQPTPDEQQFCTDSSRQSNCNISEFCTSTCKCYDVDGEIKQDSDTNQFKMNNTKDQTKNPVICLNCDELLMLGNDIRPVDKFLKMDRIDETIPEGVNIPPQMNNVSYPCGDSGSRSMAACIIMSLGLSLICASLLTKLAS